MQEIENILRVYHPEQKLCRIDFEHFDDGGDIAKAIKLSGSELAGYVFATNFGWDKTVAQLQEKLTNKS